MSSVLRSLLFLREVKRQAAWLVLQRKRQELERAGQRHRQAEEALLLLRSRYGEEVDACYAPVMGKITDLNRLQDIAAMVADLGGRIERQVEDLHDAADHLADLTEEHREMLQSFMERSRKDEQFADVVLEIERAARAKAERQAEASVEEIVTGIRERERVA